MNLKGKTVAITGASSGIGKAAALEFARQGCRVALAARNHEALRETARACLAAGAAEATEHEVDVTSTEQVQAWAQELGKLWDGRCDVLVANAGIGNYGRFFELSPAHFEQLVQTNVLGVWRTVHAFGPALRTSRGHVLVVGSMAGKIPLPYISTYAATKAAMTSWTRGVRPDLAREGVAITLVEPGFTRTEFGRNSLTQKRGAGRSRVDANIEARGQTPEHVARAMVRAARWRWPREVDLTLAGNLGALAAHVLPHAIAALVEPGMRPRKGREPPAE